MASQGFHSDAQLAEAWQRSCLPYSAVINSERSQVARMRLHVLSMHHEPVVVVQAAREWERNMLYVKYLRARGCSVEMSAVLFRNIMAMWPPDVPRETVELMSRRQLRALFGDLFGGLLADSFNGTAQPVLSAFVRRAFSNPIYRSFEIATMAWDGDGPLSTGEDASVVSHVEAQALALKHGHLTLLTHSHFRPEHDFYADVLQAGEALWEALGYSD